MIRCEFKIFHNLWPLVYPLGDMGMDNEDFKLNVVEYNEKWKKKSKLLGTFNQVAFT